MSQEFDPSESNQLFADLHAIDKVDEVSDFTVPTKPETDKQGFAPLNLAHLATGDWAVVVGALMTRHGITELILRECELRNLDAPEGLCTVLSCSINPLTTDVKFVLLHAPKSEFRP